MDRHLAPDDLELVDLDDTTRVAEPDHGAPGTDRINGDPNGGGDPRRLDRKVHADAVRQGHDGRGGVLSRRVDRVGGPKRERHLASHLVGLIRL